MSNNIEQAVARVIKKEHEWQEKIRKKRRIYYWIFMNAVLCLVLSSVYGYKAIMVPEQKYTAALELFENENYHEAIEVLESLGNYNNSQDMLWEIKYAMGEKELSEGHLSEAKAIFESIIGYNDSDLKINQIDEKFLDEKYGMAVELYENLQYEEAFNAFQELNGYKDSANYINLIQNNYQQQFVDMLKRVLEQREEYTVYNTKMSFEDLLQIEDPVLKYQDTIFQDDILTEQKNIYIDGVLQQKEALTYFDTDKRLFEGKWQEGYLCRIQALQKMYEAGYQVIDENEYDAIVLETLQSKISLAMAKAPVSIDEDDTNYIIEFSCINDTRKSFKNLKLRCTWNGKYETEEKIKEWNAFQPISVQWIIPISEVENNNLVYDISLSYKK